jgi:alpha-L-fucosidase
MKIDQIKQCIKYAEGFDEKFVNGLSMKQLIYTYNNETMVFDLYYFSQKNNYYPLFLQRVIEGINKSNIEYRIEQCYNMVEVLDSEEYDVIINYLIEDNPDQAKEQAIIWVLEHEDD